MKDKLTAQAYQKLLKARSKRSVEEMVKILNPDLPSIAQQIQSKKVSKARRVIDSKLDDFTSFMSYSYPQLEAEDRDFLNLLYTENKLSLLRNMDKNIKSIKTWVSLYGVFFVISFSLYLIISYFKILGL